MVREQERQAFGKGGRKGAKRGGEEGGARVGEPAGKDERRRGGGGADARWRAAGRRGSRANSMVREQGGQAREAHGNGMGWAGEK